MSTSPLPNIPVFSNGQGESDVAPDSLLAHLRKVAKQEGAKKELTLDLPGIWEGNLRVTYRYLSLDEIESYQDKIGQGSAFSASLDMANHACKHIEGHSDKDDKWYVIRDRDTGAPLTFNDRLTRYLGLPRPDEDFEYSVREVYEIMWEGNGFGVGLHLNAVASWMGVTEEMVTRGESTPRG